MRIAIVVLMAACSTEQRTELTEEAFDDRARRREIMEITLRVLDEHPRYTDELFDLAWRHEALDRLFWNTAQAVQAGEMAERVAKQLVRNPDGLRRVMIATLEAARDNPEAQLAIVDAIGRRADTAAAYLVEHPEQLATVSKALVRQAKNKPDSASRVKNLVKGVAD